MIIIDDNNRCKCGAYWQGNGYCCNGHSISSKKIGIPDSSSIFAEKLRYIILAVALFILGILDIVFVLFNFGIIPSILFFLSGWFLCAFAIDMMW